MLHHSRTRMPHTLTHIPGSCCLRSMKPTDLDQVMELQHLAYVPEFHESRATFQNKLEHYPETTWIMESGGLVLAYLFAQPADKGSPPPLNDEITHKGELNRDTLHLHDLTVSNRVRGRGFAQVLVQSCLKQGEKQGFNWASLVAVQNSVHFWSRLGFVITPPTKSLESYGQDAAYLIRPLPL